MTARQRRLQSAQARSINAIVAISMITAGLGLSGLVGASHDTTAPTSSATVNGTVGLAGWYTGSVTIQLTATDDLSGVVAIYYVADGGATTLYDDAARPAFGTQGSHTFKFWAVDNETNVETEKWNNVSIDVAAPLLAIIAPDDISDSGTAVLSRGNITFQTEAADPASGLKNVRLLLDGVVVVFSASTGGLYSYTWDATNAMVGQHSFTIRAFDNAGHQAEKTLKVVILP
ncbi:MAG: Ig-like domain-containing protein [Euryarchaeota archaeon]|nr:Ig-like domain-containing protein [Euryarchaeota archaeon]